MQIDFQRWSDDMEDNHSLDTHEAVANVFGSHFMATRFRTSHEYLLLLKCLEDWVDIVNLFDFRTGDVI